MSQTPSSPTSGDQPTFGQTLRGSRLGYHWVSQIAAYCRVSSAGTGRWYFDFAANGFIPARVKPDFYVCWWDRPDIMPDALKLFRLKRVKSTLRLTVDDYGQLCSGG